MNYIDEEHKLQDQELQIKDDQQSSRSVPSQRSQQDDEFRQIVQKNQVQSLQVDKVNRNVPQQPPTPMSEQRTVSNYSKSNSTAFNLKDYNLQRLRASNKNGAFDYQRHTHSNEEKGSEVDTSKGGEDLNDREQNDINEINEGQTTTQEQLDSDLVENRFGNMKVSLFWEEKFVMIFRFAQFYGFLMMICFEVWPYKARQQWSGFFFFLIGSFQFMVSPSQYYDVIQSFNLTVINLGCYYFFLLLLIMLWFIAFKSWKIHYRLLRLSKRFNLLKYSFWFFEIIYFPLLINIIQYSTCQYYSSKEAIQIVQCGKRSTTAYSLMLLAALLAFVAAAVYNLILGIHLYREKVSNALHEDYLKKKEIEYVVGISEMWNSRYFYTFSSFKSELLKMYHRVIFNGLCFLFAVIHAVIPESSGKIGLVVGLFAIFGFYVIVARPYRCMLSNALLLMLTCLLLSTSFLLMLKKNGLRSALFVENYFYGFLIIVNVFGWVLIFAFLILMALTKRRWVNTREMALKAIQGQDYVIFHIKKARIFQRKVMKTKQYTEKEQVQLNYIMKILTEQFNQFRDRQPIIMDALLEVIEQLKEMKKNYEENPFLYNFDYKDELKTLVKSRYRIYEIKNI